MKLTFEYKPRPLGKESSENLMLFLPESKELAHDENLAGVELESLPKPLRQFINHVYKLKAFSGKTGQGIIFFPQEADCERLFLIGVGAAKRVDVEVLRRAAGKAGKLLVEAKASKVSVILPSYVGKSLKTSLGCFMAEGLTLGSYEFKQYKTNDKINGKLEATVSLYDPAQMTSLQAVQTGQCRGDATNLSRNLGNMPPNDLTPTTFAQQAEQIAESYQLGIRVLEEAEMEELGMGMLLGVSRGSREPAKLVILEYKHEKAKETIAFVGKGVTFDSGGISLKPGKDMDEMKFDMCGAAAVLGAMCGIGQMRPNVNVIAAMPLTENLPDGKAQRPGDIVTAFSGKKVEILNTDAEGRLILGDAMAYIVKNYKPKALIDLATLTGACIIALGHYATGAITNNDRLLDKVLSAATLSGERVWQLPAYPEYEEALKGKYADLQNVGGRDAGTITAGLFLKNFVENTPWVHLDIAGTAWGVKGIDYIPNDGASGVGVRLLMDLAMNWK